MALSRICRWPVHPRVCGEQFGDQGYRGGDVGSSPRVRGTVVSRRAAGQCVAVHPRVCGEQTAPPPTPGTLHGSSPRVRGTARFCSIHPPRIRFIPACAGNSIKLRYTRTSRSVHPRVCGEQPLAIQLEQGPLGSSPRVRGTGLSLYRHPLFSRFIPACAGNSYLRQCLRYRQSVHPRVCGEQALSPRYWRYPRGSSPRVRGTAKTSSSFHFLPRFIPACAGNRRCSTSRPHYWPVHPRVCGEQFKAGGIGSIPDGSSPRVRGTVNICALRPVCFRFIPACAGNRVTGSLLMGTQAVHPRVCGEQASMETPFEAAAGSSPRVRGTVKLWQGLHWLFRFIPACAGNSSVSKFSSLVKPVHPRVCGEQIRLLLGMALSTGSSPRVRGTGLWSDRADAGGRFIPACAGNRLRQNKRSQATAVHPRVCGEQ